jgi:hypothetical protein
MPATLEERVKELERQVARLKEQHTAVGGRQWLDDLYGAFAGDPVFKQAMRLGRDYRKSLRPRAKRSRGKSR